MTLARGVHSSSAVRIDALLIVSLVAIAGGLFVVEPLPTALALGGAVIVLFRQIRVQVLCVALAFGALGAWRAKVALVEFAQTHAAARAALGEPRRCHALARVETSPTRLGGSMTYVAELVHADCEGRDLPPGFRARLYGGPPNIARGDELDVVAQLAPVQLFRNRGVPDPRPGATRRRAVLSGMLLTAEVVQRSKSPSALVDRVRNHVRARIDATFAPDASPLARALTLGESDLDAADDRAFKLSGLAHLLAVSGTHLVLAVVSLVRLLTLFVVRIESLAARYDVGRGLSLFGAAFALVYADFAGGSGSAWRAAWMLAGAFLVRALGRHFSPIRALSASLLVGALVDPLIVFDISFLLSAAATTGLLVIGRPLGERTRTIRFAPLRWVVSSLATTCSAMLPCAPLLALLAPELGLVGTLANVIAAPIGELAALPLCLVHVISAPWPLLERGVALVGSGALLFVRGTARAAASVSFLRLAVPAPNAWHFVVAAVAIAGLIAAKRRSSRVLAGFAGLLGLIFVELATVVAGRPHGTLRVSVLDVGQGDSLLIDLPDGRLMLVDGGGFVGSPVDPGRAVILPVLRARRRKSVDIVVLTHPHPDHFTGLASALPELDVGELWDSGQGETEGAGSTYAGLISGLRARGIPIQRPRELCNARQAFGGARITVLAPCPDFVPHRDANDNSLVLAIVFGERHALLMGDAEAAEESEVVHAEHVARADFLKVGHHGSRTSTSMPLLDAVRPDVAAISCGVRNRFGHPRPETLRALGSRGIHILRTDLSGGVEWKTDGHTAAIATTIGPW